MRKTSQDGGDSTSITSGIENEVKKSGTGITKLKRNSIKKKVFGQESDDGVVEPLLQKDKEKPEFANQGAKYSISKIKTDSINERTDDRDRLLPENEIEKPTFSSFSANDSLRNETKDTFKPYVCTANSIHNHMNVNVFSSTEGIRSSMVPKTQVLIEIDGKKPGSYNSGPLIFTTAKIHTDGKTTHMEPVQVTPVPILSTVEGNVIKTSSINENDKKAIGTSYGTSNNIISSVNFAISMPCKNEPVTSVQCSGVSKIKPEEKQGKTLSNKITSIKCVTDTKNPSTLISASKINDIVVASNEKEKDSNPTVTSKSDVIIFDKPHQSGKEITNSLSDRKAITTMQEMDINKNFQAGPSKNNMKMSSNASMSTKDIKPPDKIKTPTSAVITEKNLISSALPTTTIGTSTKSNDTPSLVHVSDKGHVKSTTLSNTSTVTSLNQSSVKIDPVKSSNKSLTSSTPSTVTNMLVNREIAKQEQKAAKQQPIPVSSITSSKTPISSLKSVTTTVGNTVSSKPSILPTSSIVSPTNVKSLVSSTSSNVKSAPGPILTSTGKTIGSTLPSLSSKTINSSAKSPPITSSTNVKSSEKSSTVINKPLSATATLPSTSVSSIIKSSVSTSNGVLTTAAKTVTSPNKPLSAVSPSTTVSTSFSAKSSIPVTSSTNKPVASTVTNYSSVPSITPNTLTSSTAVSTKTIKPKDVLGDNKTKSAVTPASQTTKVSTTTISTTAQKISNSQPTSTTVKTSVNSEKPGNVGNKTTTMSTTGPAKVTQTPSSKPSSSQNNSRAATVSSNVSTSSQVSKPISKSNELQNNEHKKEKLK